MQQTVDDLKQEVERLKLLVNEQREMLKKDVALEILPAVQDLIQTETKRALASRTIEISMNPGFLKDYYNKLAAEDKNEYLDALDYAHSEVQKILEIVPNLREKIFKLRNLFEVLQGSNVKMLCSAVELGEHNFNHLSDAINMLPKIIIPEIKKETKQQPATSSQGAKRPYDSNYRRNDYHGKQSKF